MNKRQIVIGVGIAAVALGWYAFRPELLFVNKQVNEQFPTGVSVAGGPVSLEKATSRGWLTRPKVRRPSTNSPKTRKPCG